MVVRSQRRPETLGTKELHGQVAVARTPLVLDGVVFLRGERWQATSEDGRIREGEEVVVTRVKRMYMWVARGQMLQQGRRNSTLIFPSLSTG